MTGVSTPVAAHRIEESGWSERPCARNPAAPKITAMPAPKTRCDLSNSSFGTSGKPDNGPPGDCQTTK